MATEETTTNLAEAYLLRQRLWPGFTLVMGWKMVQDLAERERAARKEGRDATRS